MKKFILFVCILFFHHVALGQSCLDFSEKILQASLARVTNNLHEQVLRKLPPPFSLQYWKLDFSHVTEIVQNRSEIIYYFEIEESEILLEIAEAPSLPVQLAGDQKFKITLQNRLITERKFPFGPIVRQFCVAILPYTSEKLQLLGRANAELIIEEFEYSPSLSASILEYHIL